MRILMKRFTFSMRFTLYALRYALCAMGFASYWEVNLV